MTPLFKKLNLKDGMPSIVVLNAPKSFDAELKALLGVKVHRRLAADQTTVFAIAFATTQQALDEASAALAQAAEGDAILWFAYPKGRSKNYRCEFNRDSGWTVLGDAGFEAVRQVAIDDDWSALRFRRVEHIQTMTRDPSRASSAVGQQRTRRP